jgi:FkbM family methyltransferase
MNDATNETTDDAERRARRKARQKEKRNLRHAHAEGLMLGIVSMLRPGDIALDCGANVGEVTSQLAASGAHVHAFEPDPFAFGELTARVGHLPNVTLHNAAVGTEAGTIQLMRAANFDDNPKAGSVKSTVMTGGRNIDEGEGIDVPLIDLMAMIDDLVATHGRVAFLKMDIEGAELPLIEAMLARGQLDHIGLTVVETHERKFRDLRDRYAALREGVGLRYPKTTVNLDWI